MNFCKRVGLKRIIFTISSIIIIGFIFLQSFKPGAVSSSDSGRVLAFLNKIASCIGFDNPFTHEFVRTCAHFTEFFVLGMSLLFMYRTYFKKLLVNDVVSTVSASVIALCDECIQLFTEGRAFQVADLLIDTAGAFSSVVIISALIFICVNKHRKQRV